MVRMIGPIEAGFLSVCGSKIPSLALRYCEKLGLRFQGRPFHVRNLQHERAYVHINSVIITLNMRMHLNGSGSSLRIPKKRPEELCLQSRLGTTGGRGGDRKKTPHFRSPGGSAKMIFCATPMEPIEQRYSETLTIWLKKWAIR